MPVFNIPAEYYGLVGLSGAIGQINEKSQERRDRRRREEREDFVFEDAKLDRLRQEEADIIRNFGQGSERHAAWRAERKLPNEGIIKPLEVRNQERLTFLETKPEETLTEIERAEKNFLKGIPIQGFEGLLEEHKLELGNKELMNKVQKLALAEAQLKEEQRRETRRVLAETYGTTPEKIDALMQITGIKQAQANLGLTYAQITATNALAAEREADAQTEAATGGYDKASVRSLTAEMNKSRVTGNTPFSIDFVQKGLGRTLPPDDQRRFDVAWQHYNLQGPAKEVNKLIQDGVDEISKLKARRAVEARREEPNKETLAQIDADIAAQEASIRSARERFNREKSSAYRSASGGTSAPNTTPGVSTGAGPSVDPEALREAALEYASVDDIENDPALPAEAKGLLKAAFVAARTAPPETPAKPAANTAPPKEAPTAPAPDSFLARNAAAREVNKIRAEKERLTREISKLEKDISTVVDNPMATKEDKAKLTGWRSQINTKKARLDKVNELLKGR